jgi:hypothetical protein
MYDSYLEVFVSISYPPLERYGIFVWFNRPSTPPQFGKPSRVAPAGTPLFRSTAGDIFGMYLASTSQNLHCHTLFLMIVFFLQKTAEIRHLGHFIIRVFTPLFFILVCVTFKLELLHVTISAVMST